MMTFRLAETKKCPVCQAARPEKAFYRLDSVNVFSCPCGMKYIDPALDMEGQIDLYKTSETLKEINPVLESYYEYAPLDARSSTCRDYREALKVIEARVPGRSLLEVGCGTGHFLEYASQRSWRAFGIDTSAENIEKLSAKGCKGWVGNFLTSSFQEKFDVIVFWDVLEHFQPPAQFITHAKQFLKEDGLILIATPNDRNLTMAIASLLYRFTGGRVKSPLRRFYVLEHTCYFDPATMRDLFRRAKMKAVDCWQTDADLDRYRLPLYLKAVVRCMFFLGAILNQRTRFLMIATKEEGV